MNKKLIISLSIIGVVVAVAIGATFAMFNDTETSTGNILVAGTMDLKVDHTRQTYNDVDCRTCSVTVISDPTNMVIEKFGSPITSYPAVYVGSNHGGWIHPAWTAQYDPILQAAGAKWIWESDPTQDADLTNNVTYTFKKEFEWWGPITGSDLWMAVGSDNSVKVWLNNVLIGENSGEYGYKKESMLHIPAVNIIANIAQGNNVLKFEVKNWALAGSTHHTNPAGLIYKFSIDGKCGDEYFRTHCQLWGLKDLENEKFFMFDDVKPGDHGVNVISLHAYNNDAFACLIASNIVDAEETVVDPEITAGDNINSVIGELSSFIKFFAWEDDNDGVYEPGEQTIAGPNSPFATAIGEISLTESNTKYIGLAWCAGTQSLVGNNIVCDGSTMGDIAQTDILTASITAYAEQQRNNGDFDCANVTLP